MKKVIPVLTFISFFLFSYPLFAQNQLWVRDVTKFTGLDSARGSRIVVVDVNNDDYPDLLWGTGNINKNKYYLYLNIENPDKSSQYRRIFKDITAESGININRDITKSGRVIDIACMADVDNDGDMDLVTSIYYHRLENYKDTLDPGDRSEVYLNDGSGKFTLMPNNGLHDMNVLSYLPIGLINATGMSFLDYDLDGKIDLYISTWFSDRTQGIGMPDMLFKGNGDGSFTNTDMQIIKSNYYPEYGVNATDWDNDGWPDIMTSPYCNSNGNLFRNMHDGTFQDYSAQANYSATDMTGDNGQALCQWEAQPADYDNDGDMDLLQVFVHGGYDANEGRTRVSTNLGADSGFKFKPDLTLINRDAPNNSHLGDQGGQWFDLNGDGYMDIAIGQMAYPDANKQGQERLYICLQEPCKTPLFKDISKNIGIFGTIKEAHSMEPLDYDLDGDQDLFVSHQVRDTLWKDTVINGSPSRVVASISVYMQVVLLGNKVSDVEPEGSDYHRWVSIKLDAPAQCNRSAIGTRIKVFANGQSYMQDIQSGLGHFAGQQPFIRNFGLGYKPANIDSIIVQWPDKNHSITVVKGVPLNTVVEIDNQGFRSFKKTWEMKKPVIAVTNSNLDFGKIDVGTTKELSFIINNLGETPLIIDNISDFASPVFSFTTPVNFPVTVQPGNQLTISFRFSPDKREIISGNLIVHSNAFNDSLALIKYNGYGFKQEPLITSDTDVYDFGTIYVDSTASKEITLTNTGELNLTINSISSLGLPQTLIITNLPSLPATILPKQKLTFRVEFTPKQELKYEGQILISSNAYNNDSLVLSITGNGKARKPQIYVSNPNILFGNVEIGTTKEKSLHIKNNGTAELIINSIDFEMPFENNYEKLFTLPFTISQAQETDLTFSFKPDSVQSFKTDVYINSNSFENSTYTVTFIGSGKLPTDVTETFNNNRSLTVKPNPTRGMTEVIFNKTNNVIDYVALYDVLGNKIYREILVESDGKQLIFKFDAKNLSKGLLLFVLKTSGNVYVNSIMVN